MNLQKKLANLLATTKRKRPYYCEVEYLESTGTQYIDTGILQVLSTELVVRCSFTNLTKGRYGAASIKNTNTMRFYFGVVDNKWACGLNSTSYDHSISDADTKVHDFKLNNVGFYIDGTKYVDSGSVPANSKIGLFSVVGSTIDTFSYSKCYYAKIYNGSTLIRDFIPVLDWDMTPCMYDKVSGELFYNKGTGDFVAGRQIHRVEYLESTGTQYIDTGVIGKDGITAETRIQRTTTSSNECFVGAFNLVNRVWLAYTFGNNWYCGYNAASGSWTPSTPITDWYTIKSSIPSTGTVVFDCNGASKSSSYTTGFTTGVNIQLFQMGNTDESHYPARGKMSYCKLYDYGVLVRDFIPAVDENGVGYMFDRVTHTIYDNAGSGAFGYNPVELEYLESTGTQYIDTGIAPSNITPIAKMKFIPTQELKDTGIFGCYGANNKRFQIYFNSIGIGTYVSKSWKANTTYEVELNGKVPSATINGNAETSGYSKANGFSSDNMYLFTRNNGNVADSGAQLKLYYCKIWNNNVLVRNFIPCYKDGQAGMWDKVNKTFYENKGTGNFIAGLIREK